MPTSGMMMCFTSESTILPNAAPMITPTARSITLPFRAKFLNSSSSDSARPAPSDLSSMFPPWLSAQAALYRKWSRMRPRITKTTREKLMRDAVRFFAAALLVSASTHSASQALTGTGSAAGEGAMEGVLVGAKQAGSTITVTVVSDARGRYSFPAAKLAPGRYALVVRAVGYEIDGAAGAEVSSGKTATLDLKLRKTSDLAAQLSNGEWMTSVPGTDQQKGVLLNCVGCHSLERVMRSQHDADTFTKTVLPRMQGYVNQSIPQHPQLRKAERLMEERGDQRVQVYRTAAEYLATINRGPAGKWSYELKTLPRPSGRGTRVIYTEYDLPRETISPHDVIVDREGIAWYSSFGEQNLGRLDPKTGAVKEFPI